MEQNFGRKLAALDKRTRDKGVESLSHWFRNKESALSLLDFFKIWKGLYYCMWLSDKPLVQLDLAIKLGELVHTFQITQKALLFIEAFLKTMEREWHSIDRLRIDKFYLLVRKVLEQCFIYIARRQWNSQLVQELNSTLFICPFNFNATFWKDNGLSIHLTDLYLDELHNALKMTATKLPALILDTILEPFYNILSNCNVALLVQRATENIFEALLNKYSETDLEDGTDTTEHRFEICLERISLRLFELASSTESLDKNRNNLYALKQKFDVKIAQLDSSKSKKRKLQTKKEINVKMKKTDKLKTDKLNAESSKKPKKSAIFCSPPNIMNFRNEIRYIAFTKIMKY